MLLHGAALAFFCANCLVFFLTKMAVHTESHDKRDQDEQSCFVVYTTVIIAGNLGCTVLAKQRGFCFVAPHPHSSIFVRLPQPWGQCCLN